MTDSLDLLCSNCGHKNRDHYGNLANGGSRCIMCAQRPLPWEDDERFPADCRQFVRPEPPMVLNPCQNCGHEWKLHVFSQDGALLLTCKPEPGSDGNSVKWCACGKFVSKWGGAPIEKLPGYFPTVDDFDEDDRYILPG